MSKRVEDDLKPHNIQTINKILEIYKTSDRCCAIQATGTGKTYLILRLLEIYNDMSKTAVIFAPNNEIIKQTKKKMNEFNLHNAVFYTYQKLAKMNDDEIKNIKTDLIICDELHRTGAIVWGNKLEILLNSHPNSKLFGVTATPFRCFDGKDMAEKYFANNRACNISLAEALVRKIIPAMPIYVSALYTLEEEYNNTYEKIKLGKNSDTEKEELIKQLKNAKQQLEKSNGVPTIIKKHIHNYNGKYIVFCKDKKHLYKMKDIVEQWFRTSGYCGKIFSYPYYSNNKDVKRNLDNFKNNNGIGLKLLFVIDKLNEGLHLSNIDGCILLRTTSSNIIYYQQIGRAIDAGTDQKRIILDLVSNFNNLKSFNLKDELSQKVKERKLGIFTECDSNFDINEFYVNDYIQECIDVFNKIDMMIAKSYYTFDNGLPYLKEFLKKNKTIDVPYNCVCDDGFPLGEWCCKIRKMGIGTWRGNEILTNSQREELIQLGFQFNKIDESWDYKFALIKEYCQKNNLHINEITRNVTYKNENIGNWVHQQRFKLKSGKLDNSYKKNELIKMGLSYDIKWLKWLNNYNELCDYIKKNNVNVNNLNKKAARTINLYDFVLTCKKNYHKNKLSQEKIDLLEKIGLDLRFKKEIAA